MLGSVEGRGGAVIQGVTAFKDSNIDAARPMSVHLVEFTRERSRLRNEKERAANARDVVDSYMKNITVEHLDVTKLGETMEVYDTTYAKWENKVLMLDEQLRLLGEKIKTEEDRLKIGDIPIKLKTKVVIDLYAEVENELEIFLIYGKPFFLYV